VCGSCSSSFQAEETQEQWPSIPDYQILDIIGAGGMGVVYKARQISANRMVALKVIRTDRLESFSAEQRRQAIERFQTEAQAAAKIEHDHIVPIYDVGESDGRPYYSMRYVPGPSLGDLIKTESHQRRPLDPRRAALYMQQAARAVHEAHRHAILHRDLKPQNCLVEAGSDRVYVVDFGLAKLMQSGGEEMTRTGDIMGTPPYMSPEQARHSGQVTVASDVYSLGATLYALLTGRPPHQGAHPAEVLRKVLEEEPVPPRKLHPAIPLDLQTICLKCLEKEPTRRYGSAEAVAEDLERWLAGEPIAARSAGFLERGYKWAKRRPTLVALVGVILLTSWVIAAGSFFFADTLRSERDNARKGWGQAEANEKAARQEKTEADRLRLEAQASEARRAAELIRTRHKLFSAQLMRVSLLGELDPELGLSLLRDTRACPAELRDFAWGYYYRLCKRDRPLPAGLPDQRGAVAFSVDGTLLALAYQEKGDRAIIVADLIKNHELFRLREPKKGGGRLAFSPNGKLLASWDKDLILWDLESRSQRGKPIPISSECQVPAEQITFTADGKRLLVTGFEGILLWDLEKEKQIPLPNKLDHDDARAVALSLDGRMFAAAFRENGNHFVHVWDPASVRLLHVLPAGRAMIISLAFSPDGKTLAGGTFHNGEILIWDIGTGKVNTRLGDCPYGDIDVLRFSTDGTRLIATGGNGTGTWVWDLVTGRAQTVLASLEGPWSWDVTSNGKLLAAPAPRDPRGILLWELEPRHKALTLQLGSRQNPMGGCAIAKAPKLAWASKDQGVQLCDLTTEQRHTLLKLSGDYISSLALTPDGKTLAGVVRTKRDPKQSEWCIKLWDTVSGKEKCTLETMVAEAPPHVVEFSDNGAILTTATAITGWRGILQIPSVWKRWDWQSSKQIGSALHVPGPGYMLAISPDAGTLATVSGGENIELRTVTLWDTSTGAHAPLLKGRLGFRFPCACVFNRTGKSLAFSLNDGGIQIWDTVHQKLLVTLDGHKKHVLSLAFSPDGQTLASAGEDGFVRLWNVASGEERAILRGHNQGSAFEVKVAFTDEGRRLVSVASDGSVIVWQSLRSAE
jgi:WD40 repeat protein/tRNA A-37 threonylcarbamoyl transferase component Bud32